MTVNTYELGTVVTLDVRFERSADEVILQVRGPNGLTEYRLSEDSVVADGSGVYHADFIPDTAGEWRYLWQSQDTVDAGPHNSIEGAFLVDANQTTDGPVTDPLDVRVLIPRMRRNLDGPHATSSVSAAATLSDAELTAVIADTIASIIFHSNGVTGLKLEVTARDPYYLAPVAWKVNKALVDAEMALITSQAALDYYFIGLRDMKFSESIADEASTWDWAKSAAVVRDTIKSLISDRDLALTMVADRATGTLDEYISYLGERDRATSRMLEPWVYGVFDGGGVGGLGGQEFDPNWMG